jgi:hypothetical protein
LDVLNLIIAIMKVDYSENNQTEVSKALEKGQRDLEITFDAEGPLRDLPSTFTIPQQILKERIRHSATKYFLNVDYDKDPIGWVIDVGERPQ